SIPSNTQQDISERTDRRGAGEVRLTSVRIMSDTDDPNEAISTGRPVRIEFCASQARRALNVRIGFFNQRGVVAFALDSKLPSPKDERSDGPVQKMVCRLDRMPLVAGTYYANASLFDGRTLQDQIEGVLNLEVQPGFMDGRATDRDPGKCSVVVPHQWRFTS